MKRRSTMVTVGCSREEEQWVNNVFHNDYSVINAEDADAVLSVLCEKTDEIAILLLPIDTIRDCSILIGRVRRIESIPMVPILAIVSEHSSDNVLNALANGADDYVSKPIDLVLLQRRVKVLVDRFEFEMDRKCNIVLQEQIKHQEQMHNLLDNVPGGIAIYQLDGGIRLVIGNDGLFEMLGYEVRKDGVPQISDASKYIHADDYEEQLALSQESEKTGETFNHSMRVKNADGDYIWTMASTRPIYGEEGKTEFFCLLVDITKEHEVEAKFRYRLEFDQLTRIHNKETFYRKTEEMLRRNPNRSYVILRLNIERFKVINDLFGRDAGDQILVEFASLLSLEESERRTYGRLEADHFAVCVEESELNSESIEREFTKRYSAFCVKHNITICIGIYEVKDRTVSVDQMCDRANLALQTINGNYNTHYCVYDDKLRDMLLVDQEIRDTMTSALEEKQFQIYFQSVQSLSAGHTSSAEVLVRWVHPEKGVILPGRFIPQFEKNGFISKLDYYVWEETCAYLKSRRERGLSELPLSVNCSRMSLYNPNLCDEIVALVDKYGVNPRLFKLEITESAYNDNPEQLLTTVNCLHKKGFSILMDDFGSGYSSLNTLKDIPVDILKIDIKFMECIESSVRAGSILTSIVRMAKWLRMSVVAEGVETQPQLDFMKSIGCDKIQGWYFMKPMPREQFEEYLEKNHIVFGPETNEEIVNRDEFNAIFSGNKFVNQLMSSVFGAIGFYQMIEGRLETLRVNEGYQTLLGYTIEDVYQNTMNILEYLVEEDRTAAVVACRRTAVTDLPVRITIRRRHRDGRILWLDCILRYLGGGEETPFICIAFSDITEKVINEQKLHKHQEFMMSLYSTLPCGILRITAEERPQVLGVNDTGAKMYGFDTSDDFYDCMKKNLLVGLFDEDKQEVTNMWKECIRSGKTISFEHRAKKKDGTSFFVREIIRRVEMVTGTVEIQAVVSDITEQRISEINQTVSEYSKVLGSVYAEIYEIDLDNKTEMLVASKYRLPFVGVVNPVEESVQLWVDLYVLKEDRDDFRELINGYLDGSNRQSMSTIEYRANISGTRVRWLTSTILMLSYNKALLCTIDNTQKKLSEELTRRQCVIDAKYWEAERNRIIIEQTKLIYLEWDLKTHTFTASEGLRQYVSSLTDPFLFVDPDYQFPEMLPEDRETMIQFNQNARHSKLNEGVEIRMQRFDGTAEWCFVARTYLYDEQGDLTRIIGTITSIDDRKRYEAEKKHE